MSNRQGGKNGSGEAAGAGGAAGDVRPDESILGFFYADAAKALRGVRDDAERLAAIAERVGRHVEQVGIGAAAEVLRDFHLAVRQQQRAAWLTGQLISCLDLGDLP